MLVGGVALDELELGTAVNADLKDADRKLGRTTALTAASIGGSWAGGALGAKAGALLGALAGPLVVTSWRNGSLILRMWRSDDVAYD